jgi:hypothetical protein
MMVARSPVAGCTTVVTETIERLRPAVIEKHAHLLDLLQHYGAPSDEEAASLPPLGIDVAMHDRRAVK